MRELVLNNWVKLGNRYISALDDEYRRSVIIEWAEIVRSIPAVKRTKWHHEILIAERLQKLKRKREAAEILCTISKQ